MQAVMDRLERLVSRRRRWVIALWLVAFLAALPFAARQTEHLTSGGFEAPGSGSKVVNDAIEDFPGVESEVLVAVLAKRGGDAAAVNAEIDRVARAADEVDHVSVSPQTIAQARSQAASKDVVLIPFDLAATRDETADAAVDLREELEIGQGPRNGVEPYLAGQQALWAGMQDLSKEDLEQAEGAGFPFVLIVLLAVFGSLAAAAMPLMLGVISVVLTGALIFFLSQAIDMSVFVTNIASMLGIGVAVDYSLFVLSRYREEIAQGITPDEARRTAMRTSGLAVAFSGVTVLISLAGLFLVDSKMMHSMAVGAIVVVAISILGATTLLPALIGAFGRRAYQKGRVVGAIGRSLRRLKPKRPARTPFWERWTAGLMRRPVLYAAAASAVLLALAIPALSLQWGNGALAQFPKDYETRVGAELAAKEVGPGEAGPTQVLVRFDRGTATTPANRQALDDYVGAVKGLDGVASVKPPAVSRDGRSTFVAIAPDSDPEGPRAEALMERLRSSTGPSAALDRIAEVAVGGPAAQNADFRDLISGSLWKILVFVLLFSYVVLAVLLRSILLPVKAVVMNLLTVAAAYGVLVMVFQYGWFDSVLNFEHLGYVNAATPPLLLAVVFGLSMDYEVFLLSRIKERYAATGNTQKAVAQGLAASARTISSAALIMVLVFTIFAFTGTPQVKEIGIGLSVAILLDATLVRLVLVPATMELMGDWNWWMPEWLARRLPDMDFESSGAAATPHEPSAPEPTLVGSGR